MVAAGTAASPPTITAYRCRLLAWTCAARTQAGQADACPCVQAGDLADPPQAEGVVTGERAGDHHHHGDGRGEERQRHAPARPAWRPSRPRSAGSRTRVRAGSGWPGRARVSRLRGSRRPASRCPRAPIGRGLAQRAVRPRGERSSPAGHGPRCGCRLGDAASSRARLVTSQAAATRHVEVTASAGLFDGVGSALQKLARPGDKHGRCPATRWAAQHRRCRPKARASIRQRFRLLRLLPRSRSVLRLAGATTLRRPLHPGIGG
jgi:hypothetical protein